MDSTAKGAVARHPTMAVGAPRSYVLGNDVMFFDGRELADPPFTAWEFGGKAIVRPSGDFTFLMPRAVVDAKGRLQLLWGEPNDRRRPLNSATWPPSRVSSIWTASYEPGRGWSTARRLYADRAVLWEFGSIADGSTVTRDVSHGTRTRQGAARHNARLAGVVSTSGPRPQLPILYLSFDGERWLTHEIPSTDAAGGVGYPSVAATGRDVFVVFTAGVGDMARDINSVFLRRSNDAAQSWDSLLLVSRSGTHPAHHPKVLMASDGRLHVVWLQETTRDQTVVRHVSSPDRGDTWSPPEDLGPPAVRNGLYALLDACGTIHVMSENLTAGPDRRTLEHARWDGRWSELIQPFPTLVSFDADLRMSADGRPLVVFLGRSRDASTLTPLSTLYAVYNDSPR